MRRRAVNQPPAQSKRPDGQRQPQSQPESGPLRFRSTPSPRHGGGGSLTELSDLYAGQFTDGAAHDGDDGGPVAVLEVQTQTTLQQAEALLCQEVGAEDEDEAPAPLHRVQDGL